MKRRLIDDFALLGSPAESVSLAEQCVHLYAVDAVVGAAGRVAGDHHFISGFQRRPGHALAAQ